MHRLLLLTGCILLCAGIASAQSLGAIAKKEKERRGKLADNESSKVITEVDLGDGPSDDANEEVGAMNRPRPSNSSVSSRAAAETSKSDRWDDIFENYRRAYRNAKTALEFGRAVQSHCEDGTDPPPMPAIPGGVWMLDCTTTESRIERVEKSMKQIEQDCYNHARKLGIPASRARLR